MTLIQRYKRLTIWNKLGVIASIVGILGFILAIITLPIFERPKSAESKPTKMQLDTNAIASIVATTIANLKKQKQTTNYLETRFPGFAAIDLICLHQPISGRDNYIFDVGENLKRNRISLFVDTKQNLCFRVIDQEAQAIMVKVKPALETFTFGETFCVMCEFGSTNNFSFLRVIINGNRVAETNQKNSIVVSTPINGMEKRLGTDISGQNGCVFRSQDFVIYSLTLNREVEMFWLEYMNVKITLPQFYVDFNGSNGMAMQQSNSWSEDPRITLKKLHQVSEIK